MPYTDQERAYAQLHEDRCNGILDQAEYEAAFAQLTPPAVRRQRRPLLAWLLIGAVVLAALAIYVFQIGAL